MVPLAPELLIRDRQVHTIRTRQTFGQMVAAESIPDEGDTPLGSS